MKINTKDIHIYYMNPDRFIDRTKLMDETLMQFPHSTVTRVAFNEEGVKPNLVTRAHISTVESIIKNDLYPALLFEDDVKLIKPIPESFDIPEECDFYYLGGSVYHPGIIPNFYIKEYDETNYRVFYMLTAHAILFMSKDKILKYMEILSRSLHTYHDLELGKKSTELIYLTPKEGMYFYQDGYNEGVTKFEWRNYLGAIRR
jgi:hypothetical protein